jgi:hypothetical protein
VKSDNKSVPATICLAGPNTTLLEPCNPTVPTTLSTPSFTITTPSVKYDTTSMKVMALDYVDFMTGSSSPTISIIKPKNKKSMFKSDIVSFK